MVRVRSRGRALADSGRADEDGRGAPCPTLASGAEDSLRAEAAHRPIAPSPPERAKAERPDEREHDPFRAVPARLSQPRHGPWLPIFRFDTVERARLRPGRDRASARASRA